jgi:outer membrane receptor protein involved in Fe transport
VLVERAYNPGGATIALDNGETDMFDPEYMWDYEAFLKGMLPRLHLTMAANLFYNDKRNAQRGVLVPFTLPNGGHDFFLRFDNVPKAHVTGAELELSWRPAGNLALRGGLGALRSRVDRALPGEEIGNEFERAPHWSASAAADWSPAKRLQLSGQLRYHSHFSSDNFDTPDLQVAGAATVDARATYNLRRLTVFAYAHNLFDSLHVLYRYDLRFAELEDPRVVGVGLESRF